MATINIVIGATNQQMKSWSDICKQIAIAKIYINKSISIPKVIPKKVDISIG